MAPRVKPARGTEGDCAAFPLIASSSACCWLGSPCIFRLVSSGAGDLVLNVTGSFNLGGTTGILTSDPSHVFINYTGSSGLQTNVANTVDGYLFVPTAKANLAGTFFGGLYTGTGLVTLTSRGDACCGSGRVNPLASFAGPGIGAGASGVGWRSQADAGRWPANGRVSGLERAGYLHLR